MSDAPPLVHFQFLETTLLIQNKMRLTYFCLMANIHYNADVGVETPPTPHVNWLDLPCRQSHPPDLFSLIRQIVFLPLSNLSNQHAQSICQRVAMFPLRSSLGSICCLILRGWCVGEGARRWAGLFITLHSSVGLAADAHHHTGRSVWLPVSVANPKTLPPPRHMHECVRVFWSQSGLPEQLALCRSLSRE